MAFDVITPIRLGGGEVATSPLFTTLRTTPPDSIDMVKTIDMANNGATAASVAVHLVPTGDTADDTNILIPTVILPPKSIFQWSGVQVIDAGATIQANSTVAGVCVTVSGGNAI